MDERRRGPPGSSTTDMGAQPVRELPERTSNVSSLSKRLADAATMGSEYADSVKRYLASIGRRGGQKSKRTLTQAQARAMVRARMAKRLAALHVEQIARK